ncbi:MAG TPA: gluconokinase [Streptosporangiaceae bacterium]|nr:gluconokinase [Streptosporangiaceae bacterium]
MIVVIAGVAGSGKTTIGERLASRLGWRFADGDSFHPAANVAKMRAGIPLTDADRGPWLAAITSWMDDVIASGQSAVLACSALKRSYRDELLGGRDQAVMVFLEVSREQDQARVSRRQGHFFAEPLLASQFAALELPDPDERRVYPVATADQPPGQLVAEIVARLGLT